jgi:predicted Zn finger-like uncharacterized protein
VRVQVRCPHCHTPCLVAEQHLGVPVKCGRCGRSFTTRADASVQTVRLDIGTACSAGRAKDDFFTQHLVYGHLDERHEFALLMFVGAQEFDAGTVAPLLESFLTGANPDVTSVAENIAATCKNQSTPAAIAVIWDGQVAIGGSRKCTFYHQSGGRLTGLRQDQLNLMAGDWLALVGGDSQPPLDESALQREIANVSLTALTLAEQLVQGGNRTVLVVRCY